MNGDRMTDNPDVPNDPTQKVVVEVEPLRELLKKMFVKKGMFAAEAKVGASRLIDADLRGIHSDGSRSIGRFLTAMDDGKIDSRAQVIVERDTPAMAVMNGGMGLGHVASTKAMKLAIKKAKEVGTGTVALKRSQSFGTAFAYVLMAIEEGAIGYCTTNSGPATVATFGSRQAATADNDFAWGAPVPNGPPFVLDMTSSALLPAAETDGHGTRHGFAFLSSILAGPLVGARMPIQKTENPEADGSEHFFYAIDIQQFVDPEKYDSQINSAITEIKQLEAANSCEEIRIPGELEHERATRWLADGIPFHRDHLADLAKIADGLSLEVPWS